MASIIKTNSGTYRVRVSITKNGKRAFATKQGFRTKKEASLWAAERESGKVNDHQNTYSNYLLSEYFEEWFTTYKSDRSSATLYQYESTLKVIKDYLPDIYLNDFTRQKFQTFINDFGKNHARETVSKRKNHIAQSLKDAYADGFIQRDPTIRIESAGNDGKDKELKFLEEDELLKLDEYIYNRLNDGSDLDKSSYLAIYIAIHTGMRLGEIQALTRDDLNVKEQSLVIDKAIGKDKELKSTKTSAGTRVIKVDMRIIEVLKPLSGVFTPVSSNGANKSLKQALKELNCKPITFHGLRHTHASILLKRGVAINYVSERLGHSSVAITQKVYAHLLDTQRRQEEEKTLAIFE